MGRKVIVHANQKGGVGKSTSTIHAARAAQKKGLRVLVVDMDPQGNVSSALAETPLERDDEGVVVQLTMADVLVPNRRYARTLDEIIVPTIYGEGVDLAPAAQPLAAVEEMLVAATDRETFLKRAIATLGDRYDLILIDSAPSLGQLTINALVAADGVLVISQAHTWSTDGMAALRMTIHLVQSRDNPGLYYVGVLISMWEGMSPDKATIRNMEALNDIREHFPEAEILTPFIPRRTDIGKAIDRAVPLDEWPSAAMRGIARDFGTLVDVMMRPRQAVSA